MKVVIIGIDGATFDVFRPCLAQGRLPHIARLLNGGVSGSLLSLLPCNSPPAWMSIITGKNPGKHGVFGFLKREKGSYRWTPVNLTDVASPPIWEIANAHGRSAGVVNLPFTFPLPNINGYMVAGSFMPEDRLLAVPASLETELLGRLGTYFVDAFYRKINETDFTVDDFVRRVFDMTRKRGEAISYCLERYPCDLNFFVFTASDRVQHAFWKYLDPSCPFYDAPGAARYGDVIYSYHALVDEIIGHIMARCGPDACYFLISDHGFGLQRGAIYLSSWLIEQGYLALSRPLRRRLRQQVRSGVASLDVFGLRHGLRKSVGRLMSGRGNDDLVDWSRTRAYVGRGSERTLRLNLKGREPGGIVEPGVEYEFLRDELIEKLMVLNGPLTNLPLFESVQKKEKVFSGPFLEHAPDLLLVPRGMEYEVEDAVTVKELVRPTPYENGTHRMDGVLIAYGPPIKQDFRIEGASVMDIAPTVLHLLGIPVPDDMDGRVLTEIFAEEKLKSVEYGRASAGRSGAATREWSADEEQAVLDRLRGLGYVE